MFIERIARRCEARLAMARRGPLAAAAEAEKIVNPVNKAMINAQVFMAAFSHAYETRLATTGRDSVRASMFCESPATLL